MIIKESQIAFKLTPEELANEFCEMDANEQAEFFNSVGFKTSLWDKHLVFQLQAIVDTHKLSPNGRWFMRTVGEYGSEI